MPLSDAKIRALKAQEKPYRASDAHSLYLLVNPNGSKLWRFNFTFGGKQKTLALGAYPLVTLLEARIERDKAKVLLTQGIDPAAAKKGDAPPTVAVAGETFESVAERWLKLNQQKWVSAYALRLRNRLSQDVMPSIGATPVTAITPKDVLGVIRKIEARGAIETGRRIHQLMSQIFRFAVAEGIIQFDPARDIGDALAPKPAAKRRTAMPAEMIQEFLKKLKDYPATPETNAALRLLIHTAVRTNEVRFAEWEEIEDLNGKEPVWRIPAAKMKMRRDHIVPLSPQAVSALRDIHKHTSHQRWVFQSPNSGKLKPISQNTLIYTMYRMGLHSKATVHGFRSSFSTWANENQFNRDWIELTLAHVDSSIRGVYNSALYLPQRREMLKAWSDYIQPPEEEDWEDLL